MIFRRSVLALALLAGAMLAYCAEKPGDDVDVSGSSLRPLIDRFARDRDVLGAYYDIPISTDRRERFDRFYREWLDRIAQLNFDTLSQEGKIDYILFRSRLEHARKQLEFEAAKQAESAPYVPFAATIIGLEEARRDGHPIDSQATAASLAQLKPQIEGLQKPDAKPGDQKTKVAANRAAGEVDLLRKTLHHWFAFYDSYDPVFTWWNIEPYHKADTALEAYGKYLREKIAGVKPPQAGKDKDAEPKATAGDTSDIIGNPIGRDQLLQELDYEMIPYSPEELIDAARRELAWCESEMRRAAREMGYEDDWKKALEKVKNMYVEPGKQPQMIRDLEHEAEAFVDQHDLVTVPPLARETWRMEMMSPERQLVNPFFTGGDTITVSYPTEEMTYEQKMMSMRGNNIPFSRATVFHELIPGHELQLFMADRYHAYRQEIGGTPFAVEGWALYWELIFWDMKFQKTPEDRIGALFWRMHRCARIIFSLSFHLGQMSPDECVNFLVDRVGHERENAIAEVRRSVAGDYSPLYQAAYLLGGMQIYSLRASLVGTGKMTNRQFNDAVVRENMIPIELIRASLTNQPLTRDYKANWKFLASGPIPGLQ